MGFDKVISGLKRGRKAKRESWTDKNQYIQLIRVTEVENLKGEITTVLNNFIGNRAIGLNSSSGVQIGWLATQVDMLAEDWILL